jgi:ABC-type lipoprotein release transport system permease subunit
MLILANLNMLFVPSLVNGIVHSANNKIVATYSSNIIIESADESPIIKDVQELAAQIGAINGVDGVAYRNRMSAELKHDDDRVNIIVQSISPDRERKVFRPFGLVSLWFAPSG